MRISDWSSDVCSSDLDTFELVQLLLQADSFGNLHRFNAPQWAGKVERPETLFHESNLTPERYPSLVEQTRTWVESILEILDRESRIAMRSEEQTSELQSLMRITNAVLCLNKKPINIMNNKTH